MNTINDKRVNAYAARRRRKVKGKLIVSPFYNLHFKLPGQDRYSIRPLRVRDKQVADSIVAKFIAEQERELAGILPPRAVREAGAKPLAEHLTDCCTILKSQRDPMYAYIVERRFTKLLRECGWKYPRDVNRDSFLKWAIEQTAKSPKTINQYADSVRVVFAHILGRDQKHENRVDSTWKLPTHVEKVRNYRSLKVEELIRLLAVAGKRRVVYVVAWQTGLRRKELSKLRWADVVLDAQNSYIVAPTSITKNHKRAPIRLRQDVADELRGIKPETIKGEGFVFGKRGVPSMETFRMDLTAAGIPHQDEQGRTVVFHSLRGTLATNLNIAGVQPRVAQELLRHSDIKLTMLTYTDASMLPTAEAIELLPDVLSDAKANCQKIAENGTVKGAPKIVQKCQSVSRTVQGPSNGTSQKTSKTAEKSGDLSLNGINCPDVSKTGELGFEPNENLIFTLKTMIFS